MGTPLAVSAEPRRRWRAPLAAIALAAALGFVLAILAPGIPARADVDDFVFESLDVEYELGRSDDGTSTLRVVETFVAIFPEFDQNRGMRRSIPDSYLGAPLHPDLVSITDAEGRPREAETESEDGYYSMTSRAGDFVHGRQVYVFTYTLENVTRYFSDVGVDEFYWNVNGTEWRQPFGRVTARLTLSPELEAARTGDQACYVGYAGSTETCEIGTDAEAVVAGAANLDPFETMTIAVGFERETFAAFDSSYLASPWGWLQGLAAVGLGGAIVFAGVTRRRRLRDEPGRPTIIAEYTPPRAVDALESAMLRGLPAKAIPAEVLEQAIVGSLRIEEGDRRLFGGAKLKAVLVDPSRADGDGLMLLEGLFPMGVPGEEFEFGRSDTRFSSAAQKILKAANQELVNRGLRRPVAASVRVWPIALAAIAAALVVVFGFAALENLVNPLVPIVLIVASGLGVFVAAGMVARMPLTAAGAEVRDHLEGLKVFIEWAEADRIRMLQSPAGAERVPIDVNDPRQKLKLYETLLPYAVVFGQEKEWAKELAVLYGAGNSPSWYYGTAGFDASSFSSGISTLSASTASSSSTSGGSSGGGSAGGGGGGGGGGGV
ncbi:DUF2207 domain-containing protein [Microbacterium sp. 2FI]|uniref:DUF2207 domain-containing protein n=1 Tax=Microbacterium sp. 2FI TaxID=2502193 RepID=UPI0010F96A3E|nr:DUF2207 domain-containing protein [Microbacterium sp. 2FI]